MENGAYLRSTRTAFIQWKLHTLEANTIGTIILSFLGTHKATEQELECFFPCLIAADTCKNERNGPEIALTVLIFGHTYRPNILETKIPGFFMNS